MAAPSPEGDVKIVSPSSTFVLNTVSVKFSAFLFLMSRSPVPKHEDEVGLLQFV